MFSFFLLILFYAQPIAYQQINDRHYRSLRSQSAEKQLDSGPESGTGLLATDNYEDNYIDAGMRTTNSRSSLHIEVLSSQSKVRIAIDGTVALESSSEGTSASGSSAVQHSKGRGIHVLVLSQIDGKVRNIHFRFFFFACSQF